MGTSRKTYTNTPSPRLLEKIGATNLTLADAIAEIVANSFDAAPEDGNAIIDVTIDSDRVCVVDNGLGMCEEVLVAATRLGVDMDEVVEKRTGNKGKFGLGMKTACASMGRWWSVQTRPQGIGREYHVTFDLAEWERRPDAPEAWTIVVDELDPDVAGPLGDRQHGTAVIVQQLRTKDPMAGAVLKKLGESFKPHLEAGDIVTVNGDPAQPHKYSFVPGSNVPIDISFGPSGEHRIKGWVAIDEQTHNDGQYGFNIYRKGQLVQTWNQEWFAGHLMTSRIIGEVHMDFIDATFFKLGLQQNELWRMASAEMKEFMKPIVRASRELSRKGNINSASRKTDIIGEMRGDMGLDPSPISDDSSLMGDGAGSSGGGQPIELPKIRVEARRLVLENGTEIALSHLEADMSAEGPPFDYLADDGQPMSVQTVINSEHPLFQKSKDLDQLRRLAVADSILRCLVDRCGADARRAVETRNLWLRTTGDSRPKGAK